jgi:AraC-like DNA-binding protein
VVHDQAAAAPAARLRPFVARYVGYRFEGFEPGLHAGLPSRFLSLIVSFDAPVDLAAMPDPAQRPDRFTALVGGLHASPAIIRHDGNQHGIHVHLTAWGARALFGLPAAELARRVVPLDAVLGPRVASELLDRLHASPGWHDRFAVLDTVLMDRLDDRQPIRDEVAHAWDRLATSRGAVSIGALADEIGWSRRHLTGCFRAEFGLTPKTMGRVLRFERSRDLLTCAGRPSLARVAAVCGYTDQAHLTRDWRQLAGSSPLAWLRAEVFPGVQESALQIEMV